MNPMQASSSCSVRRSLLGLCGLLLSACLMPPRGTATNTYVGNEAGRQDHIGDPDLARKFVMLGVKTERRDQFLRVQFDLKNTTSSDLAIEWAIDWKDASGFNVPTNSNWQPTIVAGMGFEPIQAVAPTPEANTFSLQIRRPTPIK